MSARQPRFEIVRTAAGWTARFRSSNGPIIMSSGSQVYPRERGAERAVVVMAEAFWGGYPQFIAEAYLKIGGRPDVEYVWEEITGQSVRVRRVDER